MSEEKQDQSTEANSNLISAAPDLLAACQEALKIMGLMGLNENTTQVQLRNAIAKAKGESV